MKIKDLKISKFKGIDSFSLSPSTNLTVITGKNGAGKTSINEAIIYGLTGNAPKNPIMDGEQNLSVSVNLSDGTSDVEYQRILEADKPNKVKLYGKNSNIKTLNSEIEKIFGLNPDDIKISTSSEVLRGLSSGDLSDILMSYIQEDIKKEDILKTIPDSHKNMEKSDIKEALLFLDMWLDAYPTPYSIDTIKQVYSDLFDRRKLLKSKISDLEIQINSISDYYGTKTLADIDSSLKTIMESEAEYKNAKKLIDLYEESVLTKKKQEETLDSLKKEIESISVSKISEDLYESVKKEEDDIQKELLDANKALTTMENAVLSLSTLYDNLGKPYCAYSEDIPCTADKTKIRAEIKENISVTNEGIEYQKELISKINTKKESISKKLESLQNDKSLYDKKTLLTKQYETLKKQIIQIPKKPSLPEVKDFSSIKENLKQEEKMIRDAEIKKKLIEDRKKLQEENLIVDFLTQCFAPKGVVMTDINNNYLKVFNDVCNDRAKLLKNKDFEIKLLSQDGINIYCKPSPLKPFLPYENLSQGEKSIVMFLLMDMINQLTGVNILLIDGDDISTMDEDTIVSFLGMIQESSVKDMYDNIIINVLDNQKTIDYLSSNNIPYITL